MQKNCNKIISSPTSLILTIGCLSITIILFFSGLFGNKNDSISYAVTMYLISSIFLIFVIIFLKLWLYFIAIYDDKIICKGLFKRYNIPREKIKNILLVEFPKEGWMYVMIVDGYERQKLSYPFKIECRHKSKKLIESFWDKPINRVKLESLVEIKKK